MSCEHTLYYRLIASSLGTVAVVWLFEEDSPMIVDVQLPRNNVSTMERLREYHGDVTEGSHKDLDEICNCIGAFLEGTCVDFPVDCLGVDRCYDFQKRVLRETMRIPRGSVTSYGDLARRISAPRAARAVGSALAKNPFPLIIPCHRVVKANGFIGQFGGETGLGLKKDLLELEGVQIDDRGMIAPAFFW